MRDFIDVYVGKDVMWFGCRCVVTEIIEHIGGNHEVSLSLNGRVYWDYLSELEDVE